MTCREYMENYDLIKEYGDDWRYYKEHLNEFFWNKKPQQTNIVNNKLDTQCIPLFDFEDDTHGYVVYDRKHKKYGYCNKVRGDIAQLDLIKHGDKSYTTLNSYFNDVCKNLQHLFLEEYVDDLINKGAETIVKYNSKTPQLYKNEYNKLLIKYRNISDNEFNKKYGVEWKKLFATFTNQPTVNYKIQMIKDLYNMTEKEKLPMDLMKLISYKNFNEANTEFYISDGSIYLLNFNWISYGF